METHHGEQKRPRVMDGSRRDARLAVAGIAAWWNRGRQRSCSRLPGPSGHSIV